MSEKIATQEKHENVLEEPRLEIKENTSKFELKEILSICITLGTLYCVSISVLYLWGYWGSFGISILNFLTLGDIVKLSAERLFSILLFSIIGYLFSFVSIKDVEELCKEDIKILSKLGRYIDRSFYFLFILFLTGGAYYIIFGSVEQRWNAIPFVFFFLFVKFFSKEIPFITRFFKNSHLVFVLLALSVYIPLDSYGKGIIDANKIINEKEYKYIYEKSINKSIDNKNVGRLKYLGYANSFIFLLSEDNKAIIIKNVNKIDDFELHTFSH